MKNDAEFKAQVMNAKNMDEVEKLFNERGVHFTVGELAAAKVKAELDEASLDNIAGGGFIDWLSSIIKSLGKKNANGIGKVVDIVKK